ncbi:BLUF domain-containing protein [Desertivirga xinjiangensis]|uniref:BLUF domain-containing protein n=1 Tax=Desertivirga xinjiangensis TaxID=539206 RepID=UPI00210D8BFB|nr:BLUF domain-containing protein [Pedobacter xinjiangensis]
MEWNAEHGISGILLYDSGNIMQVLEGSTEEVQAISNRLRPTNGINKSPGLQTTLLKCEF